jgi:predicted MFS family arabinose efflux permease
VITVAAPSRGPALRPSVQLLFAVACGVAIANITYAQPLLDEIADSFRLGHSSAGIVVTVTQVGYAAGLLLFVPLGDAFDRRSLVVSLTALSAVALLAVAVAPTTLVLLAGVAAVGSLAVVAQVLVAFAASLASAEARGRVVGTVTSGVVIGIVSARAVAGAVHDLAGWRAVYLVAACLTATISLLLRRALPRHPPASAPPPYLRLVRSVPALFRDEPVLRARATLALLTFGAFSTLWTSVVLVLTSEPVSLSHGAVGLLGLAGLAGALAARSAGRLADLGHGRTTTGLALVTLTVAWLPIALVRSSLWALVLGVVLLDASVQAVHVTSQSMLATLDPSARSRLVGGYMVFYAIGSGVGSIASTVTYAHAGWTGVCVLGAVFGMSAAVVWTCLGPQPPDRRPSTRA